MHSDKTKTPYFLVRLAFHSAITLRESEREVTWSHNVLWALTSSPSISKATTPSARASAGSASRDVARQPLDGAHARSELWRWCDVNDARRASHFDTGIWEGGKRGRSSARRHTVQSEKPGLALAARAELERGPEASPQLQHRAACVSNGSLYRNKLDADSYRINTNIKHKISRWRVSKHQED